MEKLIFTLIVILQQGKFLSSQGKLLLKTCNRVTSCFFRLLMFCLSFTLCSVVFRNVFFKFLNEF